MFDGLGKFCVTLLVFEDRTDEEGGGVGFTRDTLTDFSPESSSANSTRGLYDLLTGFTVRPVGDEMLEFLVVRRNLGYGLLLPILLVLVLS